MNAEGMWGIVTTHYQNLKQMADGTPGLVNGSMLYDRQMMQPLFRLSIGSPGSSFAVEIARKIGLPHEIIDAAEQIVGSDYINLDKYLLDITRDKRYWENKRAEIRKRRSNSKSVCNATLMMPTPCAPTVVKSSTKPAPKQKRFSSHPMPPSSAPLPKSRKPTPNAK